MDRDTNTRLTARGISFGATAAIVAAALAASMLMIACGDRTGDRGLPAPAPPGSMPPPVGAAPSAPVDPETPYILHVIGGDEKKVTLTSYKFPYKDIAKRASYQPMALLITKLPSKVKLDEGFRAYRMSDGQALAPSAPWDAISGGNLGLIVVPADLLAKFPDEPTALKFIDSQIAK
jgi:hypothetical protein